MFLKKVPHYFLRILIQEKDHYMAYSPAMGMYYITASIYSAEKFMSPGEALESYKEYCDIHEKNKVPPKYTILGMNPLVNK